MPGMTALLARRNADTELPERMFTRSRAARKGSPPSSPLRQACRNCDSTAIHDLIDPSTPREGRSQHITCQPVHLVGSAPSRGGRHDGVAVSGLRRPDRRGVRRHLRGPPSRATLLTREGRSGVRRRRADYARGGVAGRAGSWVTRAQGILPRDRSLRRPSTTAPRPMGRRIA